MTAYDNETSELMKLAESLEDLARTIEEEAGNAPVRTGREKTASRRSVIDYGTLGDDVNAGAADPLTRFALG